MNDRLAVFFDSCVFEHDTGKGFFEAQASPYLPVIETHPENSDRLRNMYGVLKEGPIAYMQEDTDGIDDLINRMRSSHQMAATTGE
jgi:tyrosine-protein phosphatase YwqE